MSNELYKNKYLKYKNKYLALKKQIGSGRVVKIEWKGGNYIGKVNDINQPNGDGQLIQGNNIYKGKFLNGQFNETTYLNGLTQLKSTRETINRNIDEYTTKKYVDKNFKTTKQIFDYMVERMKDYKSPEYGYFVYGNNFNKEEYKTMETANRIIQDLASDFRQETLRFAGILLERAKTELKLTPQEAVVFWYELVIMETKRSYFDNNEFMYNLLERKYNNLIRNEMREEEKAEDKAEEKADGLTQLESTRETINRHMDEYTTKKYVDKNFKTTKQIFDYMVERMKDYKSPEYGYFVYGNNFNKEEYKTMETANRIIQDLASDFRQETLRFAGILLERAKTELNLTPQEAVVFWYELVIMERRRSYFNNNEFMYNLLERKYNDLIRNEMREEEKVD